MLHMAQVFSTYAPARASYAIPRCRKGVLALHIYFLSLRTNVRSLLADVKVPQTGASVFAYDNAQTGCRLYLHPAIARPVNTQV